MTLRFEHAGRTDQGQVRNDNQDRWYADAKQGLYLVADGMGGGPAGGLAAQVVVDTLPCLLQKGMAKAENLASPETAHRLRNIVAKLSESLLAESRDQPGLAGMGSTVVLALVRDRQALIGYMGDSRAYRLREGRLQQLTVDHTIVQLLIESGDIGPDEAAEHPARGQLTRYVGAEGEAMPETRPVDLEPGDTLLLCTDGLHGLVSFEQMLATLQGTPSLQEACDRLVSAANQAGGKDNTTVVLVRAEQNVAMTEDTQRTFTPK